MSSGNLDEFSGYTKALDLFDRVVGDMGRYRRFKHWMPSEIIDERTVLAEETNRILSATITRLSGRKNEPSATYHLPLATLNAQR